MRIAYFCFALGLAIVPTVASLVAQPSLRAGRGRHLTPIELATCINRGGRVMIAGLSGNQTCALPYADAGKACSGSSQCLGDCMLDEARLGGRPLQPNQRVPGRCEATNYGFGCRTTVEYGRIAMAICTD